VGKPVVWWEISSDEPGRLHEFYANLFGWTVNTDNPIGYGIVDTNSQRGIRGGIGQDSPPQPRGVTLLIEVDDLQAYLDKVEEMGGKMVLPPTTIPEMVTYALFEDPDGNVIGLVKE
jgi:predicted enzyme related to lactoylglutathione lyase